MAFIVETGAIVAGANAYITVGYMDDYFTDRNVPLPFTISQKQAAIIISTQYANLNNRWRGVIVSDIQSLPFPRKDITDNEGRTLSSTTLPTGLMNAIAEYAHRQLISDIQPDVDTDTGAIITNKSKLGQLEKEVQYAQGSTGYYGIKRYPLADKYLIGLRVGGNSGNMGRLIRG
jgi:hypothetical protein